MSRRINAVLLSAFILPGLGQLYKGDKIKGVIFIFLVNIFFLIALFIVLKNMGNFLITARISGQTEAMGVLNSIQQHSSGVAWLMFGFVIIWIAAIVDAAKSEGHSSLSETETSSITE
ncbi:MAG: hypothetical protein FWD70_02320 [Desulfuromonadales bacterium]|nr:hypothetical protein [Desulfuromonadales bacterium]